MICNRTIDGAAARTLTAQAPPFGLGLTDTAWVQRVEVWYPADHEGVDFVAFRMFDATRRRKTIRIPGF